MKRYHYGTYLMAIDLLRRLPALAGIFALFFLVSCTTTVRSHNEFFKNFSEFEGVPESKEQTIKLADRTPQELLDLGERYLANANYQLAKLHFVTALGKDPKMAAAYIGLGKTLMYSGYKQHAEQAFSQALLIDPVNKTALIALGRLYRDQGEFEHAKKYLDKALSLDSINPVALSELAITYDAMGEMKNAEPLYEKVRLLRSDKASSYNNIGVNRLLQGKYDQAIKALEYALKLQPKDERIRNNIAAAYALSGAADKALQILESTVGKAGAYNNIGYLYITQGKWEKAEQALGRALELNPHLYVRAKRNLALLRRKRDKNFQQN